MKRGYIIAALSLMVSLCTAQSTPTRTLPPKSKVDPCQIEVQKSFSDGWNQATEKTSKEEWGKGFRTGIELEELLYSVKLSDSPKLQNIQIVVEDIEGSTSYQFAAAEVIRSYFSDMLLAVPESALSLHISGKKSMALGYGADVQSVEVEVTVPAAQTLTIGAGKRVISGSLQLASGGGTMKGYSQQEKTQAIREYIYKVLSEYKEKWEKAAPKDPQ